MGQDTEDTMRRLMSPPDDELDAAGSRETGKLSRQALGEDDMDMEMGGDDMGPPMDDMGGDDMGMGDEMGDDMGSEMLEVDSTQLRELLDAVEMGEKSADEAYEECCASGEEDLGELEDDMGGDDMGGPPMDDMSGLDDLGECMESVDRIASMLTEDPDVFNL
jgi:hypothetical protein